MNQQSRETYYMEQALIEAKKARAIGEVPIGAVVVYQDTIIGRGYNQRETSQNATTHAEMIAIQEACDYLKSWRLENCELYVTLEPCPMCSGAIIMSRVSHVYFGARDPKGGTVGSLMNLLTDERFNHQPMVTENILAEECGEILTSFFKVLRRRKKSQKEKD